MTKFWNKHKKTLLWGVVCTLFVGCFILANFLARVIIPTNTTTESISAPSYTVYLISLSKSQLKKESISRAKDFQTLGAGGYIWEEDKYYHVITSAYLNKNDAQLVQNNIKLNYALESELLSIQIKEHTIYGSFDAEEKKTLSKALGSCMAFYQNVYDISISLDTGVFDEMSAKIAVNDAYQTLATTFANFNTHYPEPVPENLDGLKTLVNSAVKIGQDLASGEKDNQNQPYSSLLKYRYIEMLELYYVFANK